MKHLKLFNTESEYNSATLELPNVSYIVDSDVVMYNPFVKETFVLQLKYSSDMRSIYEASGFAELKTYVYDTTKETYPDLS